MKEANEFKEAEELITVGFPAPPSFSVSDFCRIVLNRGYRNHKYDYDFNRLLEALDWVDKRYKNDQLAKAVLAHCFGELLARDFRNWVRSLMDESIQYEDAGASIEDGAWDINA